MEDQAQSGRPVLHIQDEKTAEKFDDKMKKIAGDTGEKIAAGKAATLGLEYIDLRRFPIVPDALSMIPEEEAKKVGAVCFFRDADSYRIAALDPTSKEVEDAMYQVEERYHIKGVKYVMSKASFDKAIVLYKTIPKIEQVTRDVSITPEVLEKFKAEVTSFEALQKKITEVNITDFVALVLATAVNMKSSDVHIEAGKEGIGVRLRIDGVLQEAAKVEKEMWKRIISRVKLISGLKINIDTAPQDGRFTILLDGQDVDVRVSTIPSAFGESVVMRLLRPLAEGMKIEQLGLTGKALKDLKEVVSRPNGMIITTGPTGSGKTTTLYTILTHLNGPDVKIITLEDPIE